MSEPNPLLPVGTSVMLSTIDLRPGKSDGDDGALSLGSSKTCPTVCPVASSASMPAGLASTKLKTGGAFVPVGVGVGRGPPDPCSQATRATRSSVQRKNFTRSSITVGLGLGGSGELTGRADPCRERGMQVVPFARELLHGA